MSWPLLLFEFLKKKLFNSLFCLLRVTQLYFKYKTKSQTTPLIYKNKQSLFPMIWYINSNYIVFLRSVVLDCRKQRLRESEDNQ